MEREKYYWFSITAKTRLGWGETAKLLVYTTNNRELPQAPSPPRISPSQVQSSQITFSWTPGRDGFAPIRYYTVIILLLDECCTEFLNDNFCADGVQRRGNSLGQNQRASLPHRNVLYGQTTQATHILSFQNSR